MVLSNTAIPVEYGKFRDAVLGGEIPVCEEVSMQMNRIDARILSKDYYYDDEAIEGFIQFCETEMTLTDGSDVTLLESFKLWAEDALAWYYFSDEKVWNPKLKRYEIRTVKKRLTNVQYLIVGRGAAKSMYASFMQMYGLVIDPTTTHQIVTAPTMKQAEETMQPIRTAISRARGPLIQFLTQGSILSNTWSKVSLASTKKGIQNFLTNSLVEVRPMTVDKLQGLRSKWNTVDEWLSGDVKEDVIGPLEQGASKNNDYLILATSSEGTARDGVGDSKKMELKAILRGEYEAEHISIWHYKLDDMSEIRHPDLWLKANPNIGATVSYDAYHKDVEKAENVPTDRNDILAKRFGIPVEGLTYLFKYEDTLTHNKQNFDGFECSMGVDLSQGDDFTAFTFLFPLGGERYGVKTRAYVASAKLTKVPKATRLKYDQFIKEGTLIVVEGVVIDMVEVFEDLEQHIDEHQYTISTVGYDPYNAEYFMNRWMTENGSYGVEKVRQGARTESVPLGELVNLANARQLIFDEELMKFSMGNAIAIEDNNGNLKLSKKRSAEKIDNVSALMDALVAYNRNKEVFD